jgi:outer membrane protein OmpA-like peptidoglycan-associated protein
LLRADREALRSRVALSEATASDVVRSGQGDFGAPGRPAKPRDRVRLGGGNNAGADNGEGIDPAILLPPPVVVVAPTLRERPRIVADRRPTAALEDDELYRRIQVYRDLLNDDSYSPEDRAYFAGAMRADRLEVRQRLIESRRQRQAILVQPKAIQHYSLEMKVGAPNRPAPSAVFAAEVDDSVIEQQLIAPPTQKIRTQVSRQELIDTSETIMQQPEVRRTMPGVEIDTITFGFNEAFVREEEIAAIDRIGRILEKIVAAKPNEVFMIEGHTDAVGSDAYNDPLSKKRAEAVKAALLEYYVIDPRNIATVGLGERYLKIPTPDPEEENRRVTIRRVTALVND